MRAAFLLAVVLAGAAQASDQPAQPSSDLFDPTPIAESPRFLDEVRVTASLFLDNRSDVREDGAFLGGEVLFVSPFPERAGGWAKVLLRPRPHLGALVSTDEGTSQVFAGLTWHAPLGERFFLEASFGGTAHNGETERQPVQDGPELGCPVSFRESIAVGVNLDTSWRLLASVDHSSHTGLCGVNDGLTHAGVSVGRQF